MLAFCQWDENFTGFALILVDLTHIWVKYQLKTGFQTHYTLDIDFQSLQIYKRHFEVDEEFYPFYQ